MRVDQTEDLVNDARERSGGVNDDGIFWNVFFRLMQAHSKFTFLLFSAEIGWVPCHSFIDPPVHSAQVDIEDKHTVK